MENKCFSVQPRKNMLLFVFYISLGDVAYASLADDYLDAVLAESLRNEIKKMNLDPAPLPDFGIPFKHDIGIVPITGRVDFSNGLFNGLSEIQRFAQCDGPSLNLREVKLECTMRFLGLSAVYDGHASLEQLLPIPFQVTAYINETLVKTAISGAPATLMGQVKLLEITKLGHINARFKNLGFLQYIYNAVGEEFREKIREEAVLIILRQFPMAFGKALTSVRLPGLVNKSNE